MRWVFKKKIMENTFNSIRQWAYDRGIFDNGTTEGQFLKLLEEVEELNQAIQNKDQNEFIDAVGDCVVVLTNLAAMQDIKIETCISSAYNEIKNRTGKMQNGIFVKE